MAFYTGDKLPGWKGNLFLGGLSGMYLQRVVLNERGVWGREPIIPDLRLRIRDVRQGPDGLLYLAVDATQGGILRIEPAE
jgi:glucose/arabinose dehydrogenase